LRYVQLGALIDTDPEAASLFVDIYNLRKPLSALEEPPWLERLSAEGRRISS
jgi:hypothetical protein